MSTDSQVHHADLDVGKAAALLALSDPSLFESASAMAIRALALQADRQGRHAPRSVSFMAWDDTGESLASQEVHDSRTQE